MRNKFKSNFFLELLKKIVLVLISSFLFFISHPNAILKNGFFITGFFIYCPVLILIKSCSLKNVWFYGGLYGIIAYTLYAYWLATFHPLGLLLACVSYFLILAVVFEFLKFSEFLFPERYWIIQLLIICSYEYLKTKGFAGFSYGVTAYTQWKNIYFIQIADLIGIFGLNLIVIFPGVWLAFILCKLKYKKIDNFVSASASIWLLCLVCSYLYGVFDIINTKKISHPTVTVAAIQSNEDPWKNGIEEFQNNITILEKLTDEAFSKNSKIDFVLWPETSVVPSIMYHFYNFSDEKRFRLIYNLLNYIESKNSFFILGNAHIEKSDNSKEDYSHYNSAMIFTPGENTLPPEPEVYSKQHLVPFTETFPYKKYFPRFYKKLLNGNTHMWDQGREYNVFTKNTLCFATPICFEDTFGTNCRWFVKKGARCFMNMSNDAWSKSSVCQYQHLSMAVFRSVENRVPAIRSTVSGQTCMIDENGRICNMIPEFEKGVLISELPVLNEKFKVSLYTKLGDVAGYLELLGTISVLIIQILNVIINKRKADI